MHFPISLLFLFLRVRRIFYQTNCEGNESLRHYMMTTDTRHITVPRQLPFVFPSHSVLGRQPLQLWRAWIRQTKGNYDSS